MICCKIIGRLANQMSNFAFAHAVAGQLKSGYLTNAYYLKYFELESPKHGRLDVFYNRFLRAMSWMPSAKVYRWFREGSLRFISFFVGCWRKLDMYEQPNTFKNWSYYDNGVYENLPLELMRATQDEIKQLFVLKPEYQQTFQEKYAATFAQHKTLVIHIRRGDITNLNGENFSLPLDYYHKALEHLGNWADYRIFVLSDDIEWVKANLPLTDTTEYSKNDEITDFQFFLHADVVIVANSTYSAYGAWLNKKPTKRILQPVVVRFGQQQPYSHLGTIDQGWELVDFVFQHSFYERGLR